MKRHLLALVALALLLAACPAAAEGPQAFAYANLGADWSTQLRVVNPTPVTIFGLQPFPRFGISMPVPGFAIAWVDRWPAEGGGVATVDVPPQLIAYTEVTNGNGNFARIAPLAAFTAPVQLQDVKGELEGFVAFLFLNAPGGGTLTVERYLDDQLLAADGAILGPGETVIQPLPGANRVVVKPGLGKIGTPIPPAAAFYAFALVVHQPLGELVPVYATELGE